MTSASPSGPDPTVSTGVPSDLIPAPPGIRSAHYAPVSPILTPSHLGLDGGGGGGGLEHSGYCGPCTRGAAEFAHAHWLITWSRTVARTRSTLGVVVPEYESQLSPRVRPGAGQKSEGCGKGGSAPDLSVSLPWHHCHRSFFTQPGNAS